MSMQSVYNSFDSDYGATPSGGGILGLIVPLLLIIFIFVIPIIVALNKKNVSFKKIGIGKLIFLPLLTLGVYTLIWTIHTIHCLKNKNSTNSTIEFLLVLFVPFYFIYWIYKTSNQVYEEQKKYGIEENNNSTVNLILSIFGLSIIAIIIIQSGINKIAHTIIIKESQPLRYTEESSKSSNDQTELLRELAKLRDERIIDEEEFFAKKKEILNKI